MLKLEFHTVHEEHSDIVGKRSFPDSVLGTSLPYRWVYRLPNWKYASWHLRKCLTAFSKSLNIWRSLLVPRSKNWTTYSPSPDSETQYPSFRGRVETKHSSPRRLVSARISSNAMCQTDGNSAHFPSRKRDTTLPRVPVNRASIRTFAGGCLTDSSLRHVVTVRGAFCLAGSSQSRMSQKGRERCFGRGDRELDPCPALLARSGRLVEVRIGRIKLAASQWWSVHRVQDAFEAVPARGCSKLAVARVSILWAIRHDAEFTAGPLTANG